MRLEVPSTIIKRHEKKIEEIFIVVSHIWLLMLRNEKRV